jgi:uncharacterized protein (TIGR00661 family)
MKVLFGVQSEGSGHCVQALCIKEYLKTRNYEIGSAFVAKKKKGLASFFTDEFETVEYEGFDFVFGDNGKVVIWKTILKNIYELPKFVYSFYKIYKTIKQQKPDIIVNFYEPLVGLSALLFPKIKYISFGHQYAMTLDMYPKIEGFYIQKMFLTLINYITSIRAQKVALSYYEFNDDKVIACPPILRKETYIKSEDKQDFVLVYLMNEDMLPDLIDEAIKNPDIKLECFTKLTKEFICPRNLKVYNLNGKLFQEKMKVCKAVICSGGFETSSEAILHNKPLLMIPLPNHFEQYANCNDAETHGFGAFSKKLYLSLIPKNQVNNDTWFNKYKDVLDNLF